MLVLYLWYLRSLTATLLFVYYHVSMVQGESFPIHVLQSRGLYSPLRGRYYFGCKWCRLVVVRPPSLQRGHWCG